MDNNLKYNLLIVLISVIINFILAFIVLVLNVPFLFMDSTGTVLTAVILGPVYGAMVGIISNILISFLSDSHLYFSIINAFIGLIVGVIAKKFKFNICNNCRLNYRNNVANNGSSYIYNINRRFQRRYYR